jgi:hypothetical protein
MPFMLSPYYIILCVILSLSLAETLYITIKDLVGLG